MNHKIGDLVWIPQQSILFKSSSLVSSKQKLTKTTTTPGIALLLDDNDEDSSYFSIFYDGEYWMIKKTKIYEVPSVFND
jgi:hypothetical protein